MSDGRSDVVAWEADTDEARSGRRRLPLGEASLRVRLCHELLQASAGTTREEVLERCGVSDADAFHLLGVPVEAAMEGEAPFEGSAESFGREAEALGGFRWLKGMRLLSDARVLKVSRDASAPGVNRIEWLGSEGGWTPSAGRVLDIDDEGTAGCLLSLLGGRTGVGRSCQFSSSGRWVVAVSPNSGGVLFDEVMGEGSTLGRACVSVARAWGGWCGV